MAFETVYFLTSKKFAGLDSTDSTRQTQVGCLNEKNP